MNVSSRLFRLGDNFHLRIVAFAQLMRLKPNIKANSKSSLWARCVLNFDLSTLLKTSQNLVILMVCVQCAVNFAIFRSYPDTGIG